jgi:hypothetical protein
MKVVARKTVDSGPSECEPFFERVLDEQRADPNNIIYDYETEVEEQTVEDPAEFHIWKRRQMTENGDPEPKSPCDDKGYPVCVGEGGELTRDCEGNPPAWGPWVDGSEGGVSVGTVTVPSSGCRPKRIRPSLGGYPSSEEEAERAVRRDREHHRRQQERRVNKIRVEYDIREHEEASEHPEWKCRVTRERARDYPEGWEDVDYDPAEAGLFRPITIHLSWKEKRDGRWVRTGAGNFKGRKDVKKWARENRLYAARSLHGKLGELGFNRQSIQYGSGYEFWLPAPGGGRSGERGDDVCLVESIWSSYYDPSFSYTHSALDESRLLDPGRDRDKIPIGGYGEFTKARFSVAEISGPRGLGGEKEFTKYEEKAPGGTVRFCREKFDEAVGASLVKIGGGLPKVRS